MASEFIAGLSLFKTAFDIAKGLKDINDATIRNGAIIELQEMILSAQQSQSTLIERISELEKEMARLKDWETQKQRYELKHIPPSTKVLAYELKPDMAGGEPPHWICTTCYENGKKGILQPETRNPGRCYVMVCHLCKSVLRVTGVAHN